MSIVASNNKIVFNDLTSLKDGHEFLNGKFYKAWSQTYTQNPKTSEFTARTYYIVPSKVVLLHVTGTIYKDMTDKILYYSFNNELRKVNASAGTGKPYTIAIPANPNSPVDNIDYYLFLPYIENLTTLWVFIKTHSGISTRTDYNTTTFNITLTCYLM